MTKQSVYVLPGEHPGDKAIITVEPETSYYELDNRVVTSSVGVTKRVGIHRGPGVEEDCALGLSAAGRCGHERANVD